MSTKQMLNPWRTGACAAQTAAAVALVFLAITPAQASYVVASLNNGAEGVACGSNNPTDPGEPCYGAPNNPTVSLDSGALKAFTGYGVNKVYADAHGQAASEWMVHYNLAGATPGSKVNLLVSIAYDVEITAALNSEAEFRMVLNNETLAPFIIRIATDGLGNRCDDVVAPDPCISGLHTGEFSREIEATVGPNNRFILLVQAGIFGGGLVDAYNTVTVQSVIVPDGITWSYNGVAGNPLNLQYAAPSGEVPEPATFVISGLGLAGLGLLRRMRG